MDPYSLFTGVSHLFALCVKEKVKRERLRKKVGKSFFKQNKNKE